MKKRSLLQMGGYIGVIFLSLMLSSSFAFKDAPAAAPLQTKDSPLQEQDVARFTNAITQIKDFYVDSISDKKLLEDAIRGMLSGLDPHSEYLDEGEYKTLLMSTAGEFGGLGIEVTGEYGVLKVVSPIDDTPAAKAGIKSGDYIVALDGKLVNEMTMNEAVDKMRGKKGTPITLTVLRKGEKAPLTFKLIRDNIQIASVKSKMIDGKIGYVRIIQFQEPTADLLISAIHNLEKTSGGPLQGLILDLRNNPGGLLESAVQVSDTFLDSNQLTNYNKTIVYTEGRLSKAQFSAKATPGDILKGAPIVILINEGSASASEIVAGALQDYRRAVVVGESSFGKGSVQTVLPLDATHAIKLTTALYHTPSGRVIQNEGIRPDILIENLKIQHAVNTDEILQPIKEFQLKGRLDGKKNNTNPLLIEDKTDLTTLANDDFQLYEAVKILKTMEMVNNTGLKPSVNSTQTAQTINSISNNKTLP